MKIPGVGPDVEQAIEHFFGLTFLHNAVPIFLFLAVIASLAWAFHKPTRSKIMLFVGCALLLLHFEYIKHIMPGLLDQTQVTLTTETPNYRFIWITDKLIQRIIPFGLLVGGWGSILVVISRIWYTYRHEHKSDNPNRS